MCVWYSSKQVVMLLLQTYGVISFPPDPMAPVVVQANVIYLYPASNLALFKDIMYEPSPLARECLLNASLSEDSLLLILYAGKCPQPPHYHWIYLRYYSQDISADAIDVGVLCPWRKQEFDAARILDLAATSFTEWLDQRNSTDVDLDCYIKVLKNRDMDSNDWEAAQHNVRFVDACIRQQGYLPK